MLDRALADKQRFADRLIYILRARAERIDELTSRLAQVRELNKKLDAENEHLVEIIRFAPQLDAVMQSPK